MNISRFHIDEPPIKLRSIKKEKSANFTPNFILIFLGIINGYQSFLLDYQSLANEYQSIKKKSAKSLSLPANFTEV